MGLWLPDSQLEMPELFEPGRKPVGKVKIDWSKAIAKDLVLYFDGEKSLHGAKFQNVVYRKACANGVGYDANGTGNLRISMGSAPELVQDPNGFSYSVLAYKVGDGVNNARLFGRTSNNGTAKPYANYDLERTATSASLQVVYAIGGSSYKTVTIPIHTNLNMFTVVFDSTGCSAYSRDAFEASSAFVTTDVPLNDSDVYIGGYNSTGYQNTGFIILGVWVWRRALKAFEIKNHYNNPYQFLIPA